MMYDEARDLLDQSVKLEIDYTNWKSERGLRKIRPLELYRGSNEYHPDEQWLLRSWDLEKDAERTFAIRDIHTWKKI